MTTEDDANDRNSIPIEFIDEEQPAEEAAAEEAGGEAATGETAQAMPDPLKPPDGSSAPAGSAVPDPPVPAMSVAQEAQGPMVAELVATRAELRRIEAELAELKDRSTRRQADFENFRKRNERERAGAYQRAAAEVATKLLPVLDNLRRALDSELSMLAGESDEFRHFLSGVELIYKQLEAVLEGLGVTAIVAVGAPFDPHVHEAVVTEETDEYEPDTVTQEIARGYMLGDRLIRPAMVKVAVRK